MRTLAFDSDASESDRQAPSTIVLAAPYEEPDSDYNNQDDGDEHPVRLEELWERDFSHVSHLTERWSSIEE
ncbi:hypothetical protein GCM10009777_10830 [Microbacterium pumilum]|uniref:Uncharacterized protein n=1 Tax=Microbacterium pumilum TaxID=344165 RepID=A0ABN2S2K0_9MICO